VLDRVFSFIGLLVPVLLYEELVAPDASASMFAINLTPVSSFDTM
jgi:hypothetical protein